MSILHEILTWANSLPPWQSDAIGRLLSKQALSADDVDDLLAMLKAAHGLPDTKKRTPKPLTADQIPVPIANSDQVALLAIKNLRHVNALAENKRLPVDGDGLTVIYGDNGSGKSGYSRVLKQACRARDQSEIVHPNANLPSAKAGKAEACFEITFNGEQQELHWINGEPAPAALSSLAIFDSRCARAYLDGEDDFSYVPYGLDVFEGLASLCKQLKNKLDAENVQSSVDLTAFIPLHGDTAVGRLISKLSAKTSVVDLESLASLSTEELGRHADLSKSLKENNPRQKATELQLRSRRITGIGTNAASKGALVNQSVVANLRNLTTSLRTAQGAAMLAAQQFQEGDNLLAGTGGAAWRELFEAARKFSLEAHPGKIFPDLGADSKCPLCQQLLADGAVRLTRFEAFVQQEAEKTASARSAALSLACKPISTQDLSLNLDDTAYGELDSLDAQLATDVRVFEQQLKARQDAIKLGVATDEWKDVDHELVNPTLRLQQLALDINTQAEVLMKAADDTSRAALLKEFAELDARVRLSQLKSSVLAAVSLLGKQLKLKNCVSAVKTNAISLKASELAEKAVSTELAQALNREFKLLGVGTLQVSLKSRTDKGRALHKLKLELPQTLNPGDILSEGEQRAIAIASFLAEVGLSGGRGGIVFDDPVSSLDHRRRELVARRLVAEAARRQVIVFTHDIYFLCVLDEEAKRAGASISKQSLTRTIEGYGVADSELPFEGMSVTKRIGTLKVQHQAIAKLYKEGNEKEHRQQTIDAYTEMRMTWERAVEEVLLRSVVIRFRKGVETQRLAEVVVDDSDYAQVESGMAKCSNYAHDKAQAGGVAVPDPDELIKDIEYLDNWRKQVESRSKDVRSRRKT